MSLTSRGLRPLEVLMSGGSERWVEAFVEAQLFQLVSLREAVDRGVAVEYWKACDHKSTRRVREGGDATDIGDECLAVLAPRLGQVCGRPAEHHGRMSVSNPIPGWYPDPAGGGSRWWDGRGWTDFRNPAYVTIVSQPPLPAGVSTGTVWIYLQALIPLGQLLAQVPYLLSFRTLFAAQLALTRKARGSELSSGDAHTLLTQYTGVLGTFGLTFGVSLVLSAAWVVFALLDFRRLERMGVVQPFHWAWSFLGPVYAIGRAVVLRRRIGRGMAPLWVLAGTVVGSVLLAFGLETVFIVPLFTNFVNTAPGFTSTCGC